MKTKILTVVAIIGIIAGGALGFYIHDIFYVLLCAGVLYFLQRSINKDIKNGYDPSKAEW